MKKELKTLDLNAREFTANGTKYIIEGSLSIARYALFEQFQIETGFGTSFSSMVKGWQKVYDLANNTKFADIAVLAYNVLKGSEKILEKSLPAMKICALIINTEDEDRRSITPEQIEKKINDWQEEGYDYNGFLSLAAHTMGGLTPSYRNDSPTSSGATQEEEK